ncbi:MAG: prepilin-type N-terminal cleavage/methylation domain-containing protein [Candidatus Brocadiae bacterium]|nr:prepilin-type N-terminal cleavage/methylation domain-containing protein [Candidatus Brocadiia bacterium]
MRKRNAGFTMVEMLVVVAIILILVTSSISILSVFMRGQGIKQAGSILGGHMMRARQLAVAEKVRIFLEIDETKQVVRIWRDVDPDGPTSAAVTYSGVLEKGTDEQVGEEYPLPKNISFDVGPRTAFGTIAAASPKYITFFPDGTMVMPAGEKTFNPNTDPKSTRSADMVLIQNGQAHEVYIDLSPAGGKIRKQAYRTE